MFCRLAAVRPWAPRLLLFAFSCAAFAQPTPQVLVTATRMEQAVTETLASTTILTREDIRDTQAPDLPTLLRGAAGIEIAQSGGVGANASVFMRGGNSNHTLILLDGMRINSATTSTTALERLTLDQIERVEIVRGNVSALYGSEAIGGVIQLFTRQGAGASGASGSVTVGSRDTRSGTVSLNGRSDDTRFYLGVAGFQTANFSAIDPNTNATTRAKVNPDNDGVRNTTLNATLAHMLNPRNEVGIRLYDTRGVVNFDNSSAAAANVNTNVHQTRSFLTSFSAYSKNRILDAWKSTLTFSKSTDSLDQTLNYNWDGHIRTDQRQVSWQNEITLAPTHKLLLTAESSSQRAESESATTRFYPARRSTSWIAGYSGSVDRAEFQLNLRGDRYSDFGRANTYFAAAGYNVTNQWKLLVQQSTAFNAPTFNQLYFPGFGSPGLQPEIAKSRDFGAQWANGPHLLRLTRFRTDYSNLIQGATVTPFLAINVAKARVNGWEANYTGQLGGFEVRTNLTLQDPVAIPEDSVTGPQLRRRAQAYGNVGVYRSIGAWRFGADFYSSGKRVDTEINAFTKVTLASYNLLTLTMRYNVTREVFVAAKLENAGRAQYQLAHGFNSPPQGLFVTVGYQPK
jgi:vitamin B12 transporter